MSKIYSHEARCLEKRAIFKIEIVAARAWYTYCNSLIINSITFVTIHI